MLYLGGDGELVCIDVAVKALAAGDSLFYLLSARAAVLTANLIRQLSEAFTCKKAPILRIFFFNTVSLICTVLKLCFPAHLFTATPSNFTLTMSSINFLSFTFFTFQNFFTDI